MSRANDPTVRNPVLALPGVCMLQALPGDVRALIVVALVSLRDDARVRADLCWRKHKAPMACYWKAVGVYANHFARALK